FICDKCGAMSKKAKGWKVKIFGGTVCASCLQQEKQTKLLEEQTKLLKGESVSSEDDNSSKSNSQIGLVIGRFLILFFKWIFCFIWGGPYILYKGVKGKSKLWILVGIEFIIVFMLGVITTNLFPEGHSFYYLNYIFVALILVNVGILIYFYVKKRHDFDEE
ncbi:MAG: hypothetical protein K2J93_03950, partial [Anaeroplasmataceae bacterium]|nr:hypothetical protein [Anaeroplasmataceae bacterium]